MIARRQSFRVARFECAVLEGSHGVDPGLAGAVDETAVDPARHPINLKKKTTLVKSEFDPDIDRR